MKSFSEGFGDYLAVSHTYQIHGSTDTHVFNWDGHNTFWQGREITTVDDYDDWVNSSSAIYSNGTIFAHALWMIFNQLGPDTTDRIVFEGLKHHVEESTIKQVAEGMIDAAELLYSNDPSVAAIVQNTLALKKFVNSVGIQEGTDALPRAFRLGAAYPNPFNPSTAVTAHLATPARLTMTVYNNLGRRVLSRDLGLLSAGDHRLVWRAQAGLASGVYLLQVEADQQGALVQRVVLVR